MGVAAWVCFGMVQAAEEQQGEEYEGSAKHWEGHRISEFISSALLRLLSCTHSPSEPQAFNSLMQGDTFSLSPCTQQLITPKGISGAVCTFFRIKDSHPQQSHSEGWDYSV